MTKRSDSLESLSLALEILKRIPRQGSRKISAPEIRRQLEEIGISRGLRTIQRQLAALEEHFQLENDGAKPYGYSWPREAVGFSVPMLSPQESLLLALAEAQLGPLLPPRVTKALQAFFRQARSNLTAAEARLEREWTKKVRVVPPFHAIPLLPAPIRPDVLEAVCEALFYNRWLEVKYKSAGRRAASAYRVGPLGLVQQPPSLYLVVHFDGYDDERHLALHRMTQARATTLPFRRPANFDLEKYEAEGRFRFGQGKRIRIAFQMRAETADFLHETPLSRDQEIDELAGGWLEIRATVIDDARWRAWLDSFGKDEVRKVRIEG
jgi:predicted DNA-binding transcriptional regulator YafY